MKVKKIEFLQQTADCGCLEVEDNHNFNILPEGSDCKIFVKNSMLENFYIPVNAEGRGSSIETVGGNAKGFTELDDVYYFSKKLFRALKYPISRIDSQREGNVSMFGSNNSNTIARDEIKWARFLERHQNKFTNELRDLFLLHLEFRGLKKQYGLNKSSFKIIMPSPSHYKDAMEQAFREQEFSNYNQFANNSEFSKTYLVKRYLNWTTEDLKENKKGFKLDKKYFPQQNDQQSQSFGDGGDENVDMDNTSDNVEDLHIDDTSGPGKLL